MRAHRWSMHALGLLILLNLHACASGASTTGGAPAAVTDVAALAGSWTGLLEMQGSRDREDYLVVTIDGNGSYRAGSARTIGVLDTRGTLVVSGGKLVLQGENGGQGMAILYTQSAVPQRTLVIAGTASNGREYTARLHPQP
jgi:hypothetical protein